MLKIAKNVATSYGKAWQPVTVKRGNQLHAWSALFRLGTTKVHRWHDPPASPLASAYLLNDAAAQGRNPLDRLQRTAARIAAGLRVVKDGLREGQCHEIIAAVLRIAAGARPCPGHGPGWVHSRRPGLHGHEGR